MKRKKRKTVPTPTHVYRCVKQTIPYSPTTSEGLTWLAQQSDRTYNQTVRTALDALEQGQTLPRMAHANKDEGTPAGESLLKKLTSWRIEESWRNVPMGIQRAALGEAANAVARWNAVRDDHASDIVEAAKRAEEWPNVIETWKDKIRTWNTKGRKGKRPEHPGRCQGIPRRAVRGNPDEHRLFRQRKVRERTGTHRLACAGDQLQIHEVEPEQESPKSKHDAPGRVVNIKLPRGIDVAHNVYLAPGESVAKVEVRERIPRREKSMRPGKTRGTPHVPVHTRTPAQRAYRCIVTIGRRAPRQRNPGGCWAGDDPGVVNPMTLVVAGQDEPIYVKLPETRIKAWQKGIETEVELRRRYRRNSRNWKNSWNRQKTLDKKIRNVCNDAVIQTLARILDNIDALALEDTQWENLVKSARGTSLDPGKNVAAKRALNRRIAAIAPGHLRVKLQSMCARRGVWLVLTNPAKSSITCNECKHVDGKSRPKQADFQCTACRHTDHADANAAKNHRDRGQELLWKRLHAANKRHTEKMEKEGTRVRPSSTTEKSRAEDRTRRQPCARTSSCRE